MISNINLNNYIKEVSVLVNELYTVQQYTTSYIQPSLAVNL